MANTLNTIEIKTEYKHLNIREITDSGEYHRRVLTPDMDVSGEPQEIQDMASALWTDEVKAAWDTKREETSRHQ